MIASLIAAAALAASAAAAPLGVWNTSDGDSQVHITACGASVCGYPFLPTVPSPSEAHTDIHNPDPALRGRPMRDTQIFKLDFAKSGLWRGWVYNPNNGRTYKATLKTQGPETLKLTGCLIGPLCGSQIWTRVSAPGTSGDATPG